MKIAMMGAGGVGGFFGGLLAQAGCEVSFVARGAHLAAMLAHGLTIENGTSGDIHIPQLRATDDPPRWDRSISYFYRSSSGTRRRQRAQSGP